MLELLADPDSASGLARRMNLPRQTVNYHLRELEKEGFVEFIEQRQKGNCLERVVRAAARSYVISPSALGAMGVDSTTARDRFSAACLVATAARAIRDVSILRQRADKAGKTIATLTAETEIRFASPDSRRAFADELVSTVAKLAVKYNDDSAKGGRSFRVILGAYPAIKADASSGKLAPPVEQPAASVRFD